MLYEEMLDHAAAEFPNECCGLLAAPVDPESPARLIRAVKRYALVNAAASPVEFASEDRSMFAAVKDMRRLGLDIVAVYHSHPTSDPVPSRTDLERNFSPEVVNLIISLKGAKPVVGAWWLTEGGFHEARWELTDPESPVLGEPGATTGGGDATAR
jgi:proteasome lid subunit RPN8/RPN11